MNKKGAKKRIISLILTLSIITMLILSGPVSAVTVQITDISDDTPNEGSDVSFLVQVDIESGERIPVQNLTLTLTPTSGSAITCTFNVGGTNLTSCPDISISKLNSVGYDNTTDLKGRGYGYLYANGSTGTYNTTFNDSSSSETWNGAGYSYGYGYTSGYGYTASPYGELSYNITWTAPSVTANKAYSVDFEAYVSDGSTKRTYSTSSSETITVQNVAASTTTTGGGSSGGAGGASPSTTTEEVPSASDLGAPEGFTEVVVEGDSQSKLQASTVTILDEVISQATGAAKETLEKLKEQIAQGLSKAISVTANLKVYKVSNPTTGESVYRSMITLSYTADEDSELVEIIEVIPKDVAADVADLIFPGAQPEILQADPIIQWSFADVKKGDELETSYVVKGKLTEITSKTYSASTEDVPEVTTTEEPKDEPKDETPKDTVEKAAGLAWLWWLLGIIALIIIIAVIVKKKK